MSRLMFFPLLLVSFSLQASGASALNLKSYVSAKGSGSACTETAPCSSIVSAHNATDPKGIIICLDGGGVSGAASNFTISKSITIECHGNPLVQYGGLSIFIEAASTDVVTIRGMTIAGAASGTSGLTIKSGRSVVLEGVTILGQTDYGIKDQRTGGQTRLYIKDSTFSNNGGPGIVAASQGPAVTVLDNVSLLNNSYGLAAAGGNNVVITRSTISGNTTAGIHADGGAQVNVLNSVLSHNTVNINAYGTVRLQENAIQFSNTAVQGSSARSAGANRFLGNVTLGSTPPLVSGAPADVYD